MTFAATWMDLEIIILSEVNQKKKDKYHMMPLRSHEISYDTTLDHMKYHMIPLRSYEISYDTT